MYMNPQLVSSLRIYVFALGLCRPLAAPPVPSKSYKEGEGCYFGFDGSETR